MGRELTFDEFIAMHIELAKPKEVPRMFITAGTGIPDPIAILYSKNDPGLIVVTRDGRRWRGGEVI